VRAIVLTTSALLMLAAPAVATAQEHPQPAASAGAAPSAAPAAASAAPAPAEGGGDASGLDPKVKELFVQKCASCHTVGDGARVGPDLKGVNAKRDAAWLKTMIQTPSALLDSDADARKLVTEFKGVRMPDLGLSDEQVASLIELITTCSATTCDLKGKLVPVTKATPDDAQRGLSLFMGTTPFKNGAPPCVSCHTMAGTKSILAGGTLSKNVTHSFARLGDEGLDAALRNPTFAVMNKVFADKPLEAEEAFALRAALYQANKGTFGATDDGSVSVGLVALIIALLSLVGLARREVDQGSVQPQDPRLGGVLSKPLAARQAHPLDARCELHRRLHLEHLRQGRDRHLGNAGARLSADRPEHSPL
jgi:mono/diheme cytochrome c family protein